MKVQLVAYNQQWPELFLKEQALLKSAIADDLAQIEHIGSTAVPELSAKPLIDIMVGLSSFKEVSQHIQALENIGYQYISKFEDQMPERRFFTKSQNGYTTHHVHMVELGSKFWERHLLFRDYLRTHEVTRKQYQDLKLELSKKDWNTGNDYAQAKNEFIRTIEAKAMGTS